MRLKIIACKYTVFIQNRIPVSYTHLTLPTIPAV